MRRAVDDRALTHLVARDGAKAIENVVGEINGAQPTETFDPLMSMHWAIATNVSQFLSQSGMNPLYLMAGGPDDPEDQVDPARHGEKYRGRTWSRCPLCYINLAHEVSCTDADCQLDRERGFDWMIARAADDSLQRARELRLVGCRELNTGGARQKNEHVTTVNGDEIPAT